MASAPETLAILWNNEGEMAAIFEDRKGLEMSSEMSQHKTAAVMLVSECAKIWREINMAYEEELYLANLDEFVNDEEKIVSELTWI